MRERTREYTHWLADRLEDTAKTIVDVQTQEGRQLLEAAKLLREYAREARTPAVRVMGPDGAVLYEGPSPSPQFTVGPNGRLTMRRV